MFALLKSNPTFQRVFAPISSQIPLFGGFLPRFAVTDETVSAFIPPICALFKQTKLRFFQEYILTYLNLCFVVFFVIIVVVGHIHKVKTLVQTGSVYWYWQIQFWLPESQIDDTMPKIF